MINDHMHIATPGLDIIKDKEKFRARWYLCPAKKWTIGFGHVRTAKDRFDSVTYEEAIELLMEDCLIAENCIKANVRVALSQNQFDALTSFIFNVGIGAFKTSTLLRLLNDGSYIAAAGQFGRWVKPRSATRGLTIRRAEERRLFLTE